MRITSLSIFILFITLSCNSAPQKEAGTENIRAEVLVEKDNRKMVFSNNQMIMYSDFSTGETREIVEGYDPCISPDGKKIAYTEYQLVGNSTLRRIQIIDVETNDKQSLNIDDTNHYGAIWSPDGKHIAFSILEDDWQIAITNPDGSDFHLITTETESGLHSPTWSLDGQFIFAHDMGNLYQFTIEGEVVETFNLNNLFGDQFYFSSSNRFFLSSDQVNLIFEAEVDEYVDGLDEPLTAVFSYDLNTKSVNRITPEGLCITNLWLDKNDKIYFSGFRNIEDERQIYQMDLSDKVLIELNLSGMYPTLSE